MYEQLENIRCCSCNPHNYLLEFPISNTFVVLGNRVFLQSVGISIGTNCAPFLADLFLYFYEADFFQNLLREMKSPAVTFQRRIIQ